MLTRKGKYGLKALVHLSRMAPGESAPIGAIAAANDMPRKFLEAILLDLRKAGFVRSLKGRGGGYTLARAPEAIAIGAVIRALDGPLAPIPCASRTAYAPCEDCADLTSCSVRLVMQEVRDAMAEVLDNVSLAQMRDGADRALALSADSR
jgi:Rrf2 family protein